MSGDPCGDRLMLPGQPLFRLGQADGQRPHHASPDARMLGQESGDLGVGEGAQAGRGHGARPVPGRLAREELVLAHGVPGLDHPHHAFPAGR